MHICTYRKSTFCVFFFNCELTRRDRFLSMRNIPRYRPARSRLKCLSIERIERCFYSSML